MQLSKLKQELKALASKEKAEFYPRFFKAGPGEYAEGDKFIGVTVPNIRSIAKKYNKISLKEIQNLLKSKIHEERMVALFILVDQFKKGNLNQKERIYNFFLSNTKNINNWDLVDLSAPKIVGEYLLENPNCATTLQGSTFQGTKTLGCLAKSENLWERRIAIISTFAFISKGQLLLTLKISKTLLRDKHDLIHKAVGWMLRETGKRDKELLEKFLKENYNEIPRTTLRYAIEKFPEAKRLLYLKNPKV